MASILLMPRVSHVTRGAQIQASCLCTPASLLTSCATQASCITSLSLKFLISKTGPATGDNVARLMTLVRLDRVIQVEESLVCHEHLAQFDGDDNDGGFKKLSSQVIKHGMAAELVAGLQRLPCGLIPRVLKGGFACIESLAQCRPLEGSVTKEVSRFMPSNTRTTSHVSSQTFEVRLVVLRLFEFSSRKCK
jgi:hypothetical protein